MRTQFLTPHAIEAAASRILGRYNEECDGLSIPVNVERMAEHLLDLMLYWDAIPEDAGAIVYAGLAPAKRAVVFNETRKKAFDQTDGLYTTVLAHELGHWVLHVDATDLGLQRSLVGNADRPGFVYRSTGPRTQLEWQAHNFMGYLLLPYEFLREHIRLGEVFSWRDLYWLREKYDVTISALVMRLTKLGVIYVEDRQIYPCKAIRDGQRALE